MTIAELIERLAALPPDQSVMILDGFNGDGIPREINFGPTERQLTEPNASQAFDCEGRAGEKVIVLGFGCY